VIPKRARLYAIQIAVICSARISFGQGGSMPASHDMSHDTVSGAPVLGSIDFPTKANAASHKAFIRGVLLMHNFHYPQAAAQFREAEKLDSTDVMGYWGEAMTYTHPVWNQQDTAAAHRVLLRLGSTREATTFYALSLLGLNQGQREAVAYQKAYELVLPVFKAHPHHPGAAHYLIHATDDPAHASLGLAAAEAYAAIAPSATHAIHMTSHIFFALGHWDDVVSANRRAQATIRGGVLSGHIVHWLHYALIQQGRYREADVWLDSMVRQARTSPVSVQLREQSWDAAGLMAGANLADTRRWTGHARDIRVDTTAFDGYSNADGFSDLAAGELLPAMGRPAEARKEFQMALARTPRRTAVLIGLARSEWAMGNRAVARGLYKELVGIWHAADTEFPELAEARGRGR
jgi:tetratricopeptide (TPR) repeat protein